MPNHETATLAASPALRAWLQEVLRTGELTLTPLAGATSSVVLGVSSPAGQAGVLRLLTQQAWLERESDLIEHEAAALQTAQACGLAVPRLLSCSPPADAAARGLPAPALLMSHLPGEVLLPPPPHAAWLQGLAQALAAIHAVTPAATADPQALPWHFASWADPGAQVPVWSAQPALWRTALARWRRQDPPSCAPVLLHRDFHPANVLWQQGRVSGVVDWVNACWGPAGVDVAHCRLNLALLWGPAAAGAFLQAYHQARPDFVYSPHWDLDALIGWLPAPTFYAPWEHWGIGPFSNACAQQRLEAHLAQVLAL